MKIKTIRLRINNVPGYVDDSVLTIKTDAEGVPLDIFWRRRLADSLTDNCVEIVVSKPKKLNKE